MTHLCKKCGLQVDGRVCKPCTVLYLRSYRLNNRERLLAFDKARHAANPEFKRNLARKWARDNPVKHAANTAKWAKDNPAKHRSSCRQWEQKNASKRATRFYKRRQLLYGDDVRPMFEIHEWLLLKSQYDYRCLCCGLQEPYIKLTVDHVVPISLGGDNTIVNIQPLCKPCNSHKGVRTTDYRIGFANAKIETTGQFLQPIVYTDAEGSYQAGNFGITQSAPQTI